MKRSIALFVTSVLTFICVALIELCAETADVVTVKENTAAEYGSCDVHTYADDYIVVKPATCSSTGTKYRVCSVCGYREIVTIPKNPNNHLEGSSVWFYDNKPTCSSAGLRYHLCYGCNEKIDIEEVPVDPEAHKAEGDYIVLTAPTCQNVGTEAYKCSICGKYFGEKEIPIDPSAHVTSDESTFAVTLMPNCSNDGVGIYYCDLCGQVAKSVAIPATGKHVMSDEWTIDKDATCTENGIMSHHCTVCGVYSEDETEIPSDPSAHTFSDEYTVDSAPTCVSAGEKSRHCIYCDAKTDITKVPVDANAHTYNDEWIVDREPTCSSNGLEHQVCTLCGKSSVQAIIPEIEHTYGDDFEVIKVSADGKSEQVKYTCSVCGHERYDILTIDNSGNVVDGDNNNQVLIIPSESSIFAVDNKTMLISNVAREITVDTFLKNFTNGNLFAVYNKNNGSVAGNSSIVGTGNVVSVAHVGDSAAEYAISVTGDIDGDGFITASDARGILRASASLENYVNPFFTAADVNADGTITASDARKTLRVSAYLDYFETTFKN